MGLQEFLLSFLIAFSLIVMVRGMSSRQDDTQTEVYVPENGYNPAHHPYIPGVPTPSPPSHHGGHNGHHHSGHHGKHGGHHGHHGGHPNHSSGSAQAPPNAAYGEYIPYGQPVGTN
jgi:hypothetical protein